MDDEKIINLRDNSQPEFVISKMGQADASPVSDEEIAAMAPQDKVKLRFGRLVDLIANHSYDDVSEKHYDEEVILSADLLADLASAPDDDGDENKKPFVFIMGIVIGVAIAWFLLKY